MSSLTLIQEPDRLVSAPYGVPVSTLFYGHDPLCKDYKNANKIKVLDIHPKFPWVATADEIGNIAIWDYNSQSVVVAFHIDSIKESQKHVVDTLEHHYSYALSNEVMVTESVPVGLGVPSSAVTASSINGTESHYGGLFIGSSSQVGGGKRRGVLTGVPDDVKNGKAGHVRSLKFVDKYTYESMSIDSFQESSAPPRDSSVDYQSVPICSSLGDIERVFGGRGVGAGSHPPWLSIVCDQRVFFYDFETHSVVQLLPSSLTVEASGPSRSIRTQTKAKISVHSVASLGPGQLAFGCEDGCVRVYSMQHAAVVQVLRPPSGAGLLSRVLVLQLILPVQGQEPSSRSLVGGATAAAGSEGGLLLVGWADGTVCTFPVVGGFLVLPPTPNSSASTGLAGLGPRAVVLPTGLGALDACALSGSVVAVGSERGPAVSFWDARAARAAPLHRRILPLSDAAEGTRVLSVAPLDGLPGAIPSSFLFAGKAPHLELSAAFADASSAKSGDAASDNVLPPAEAALLMDLRASRQHLPSKLKVYRLKAHPRRPGLIAVGTNVGVFVVFVGAGRSAAASCVSHALWSHPLLRNSGNSGPRLFRERKLALYCNYAGMLVARLLTTSTRGALTQQAEDASAAAPPVPPLIESPLVESAEKIVLPDLRPSAAIPKTVHAIPAASGGQRHAGAAIAVATQMARAPPGTRNVRLGVSGSGRFLSVVWPDNNCFAVFRLYLPRRFDISKLFGRKSQLASTFSVEESLGSERKGTETDGALEFHLQLEQEDELQEEEHEWRAVLVDSGPGVDVAWSHMSISSFGDCFDPRLLYEGVEGYQKFNWETCGWDKDFIYGVSNGKDTKESAGGDLTEEQKEFDSFDSFGDFEDPLLRFRVPVNLPPLLSVDRYAVLEQAPVLTGRGPVGGGSQIGAAPSGPSGGKGGPAGASQPQIRFGSPNVRIKQLLVFDEVDTISPTASPETSKEESPSSLPVEKLPDFLTFPTEIAPSIELPSPPVGLFSGPLIGIALAKEGTAASIGPPSYADAQPTLSMLSWTVVPPSEQPEDAEAARARAQAARYSGVAAATSKSRLQAPGPAPAAPAPPLLTYTFEHSGGIFWDASGRLGALAAPAALHIFAVSPVHTTPRLASPLEASKASALTQEGVSTGARERFLELARISFDSPVRSARWMDGTCALVVTLADGTLSLVLPPQPSSDPADLLQGGAQLRPLLLPLITPFSSSFESGICARNSIGDLSGAGALSWSHGAVNPNFVSIVQGPSAAAGLTALFFAFPEGPRARALPLRSPAARAVLAAAAPAASFSRRCVDSVATAAVRAATTFVALSRRRGTSFESMHEDGSRLALELSRTGLVEAALTLVQALDLPPGPRLRLLLGVASPLAADALAAHAADRLPDPDPEFQALSPQNVTSNLLSLKLTWPLVFTYIRQALLELVSSDFPNGLESPEDVCSAVLLIIASARVAVAAADSLQLSTVQTDRIGGLVALFASQSFKKEFIADIGNIVHFLLEVGHIQHARTVASVIPNWD